MFNYGSLRRSEPVNKPKMTLQTLLKHATEKSPEKTAISYEQKKVTYGEIDTLSSRFAGALIEHGVKKGDRVALFLQNSPSFVIAYFGVLKAGAVVVAVNSLFKEGELEGQLCDSGAQSIVVLESLYPVVEKIRDRTLLKNVIIAGLNVYSYSLSVNTCLDVLDFGVLIRKGVCERLDLQFNPEVDLAVLQYTGGTMGRPKGVMLTHANLVSNATSFASWIRGVPEDVFLSALPFFHAYGMTTSMIMPISLGAEMVILPKFDPVESLRVMEQCGITVFCGSPIMYALLLTALEEGKINLRSVRLCISGAAPLSFEVQKRFMQATGCFLVEGYGLTEASPVTHCMPIDKSIQRKVKVGSIGVPLSGTDARIVDLETGHNPLAVGEWGELAVRGPQVMKGYWQSPEETVKVLQRGWLLTGDIAFVDSEGYFYIVDRKKDLIKHKDYSVYPSELEKILHTHKAVKFCVVIGKPDMLTGEVPKAYVVLKEDVDTTKAELLEFVNSKVAAYKAIGEVEFCKDLPINSAGKILRQSLKGMSENNVKS